MQQASPGDSCAPSAPPGPGSEAQSEEQSSPKWTMAIPATLRSQAPLMMRIATFIRKPSFTNSFKRTNSSRRTSSSLTTSLLQFYLRCCWQQFSGRPPTPSTTLVQFSWMSQVDHQGTSTSGMSRGFTGNSRES